jgi:hypothetical protein
MYIENSTEGVRKLLDSNLGEPTSVGGDKMANVAPEIARAKRKRSTYVARGEHSEDKLEATLTRGWAPSATLLDRTKKTNRRVRHQDEGWAESRQFVAAQ